MVASLYYTPTSCGAASYIAAYKAGLIGKTVQAYEVDIGKHIIKTGPQAGSDFYSVNPKGNVGALTLDNGTLLNENAAILQWIADQNPASKLAPELGSTSRYVLMSKLSFIASELHKSYGVFFSGPSEDAKPALYERIRKNCAYLQNHELADKPFLMGDHFSVADSYAYVVLGWSKFINFDLNSEFPKLAAYMQRIDNLDFVKEAKGRMESASTTAAA